MENVKKEKKIKPIIQNLLDELSPFLVSIIPDPRNSFKPVVTVICPTSWDIPYIGSDYSFTCPEETETYSKLSFSIMNENLMVDDLVEFIKKDIIGYNLIIEKKEKQLAEKIRKIEEEKNKEIAKLKTSLKKKVVNTEVNNVQEHTTHVYLDENDNLDDNIVYVQQQPIDNIPMIEINHQPPIEPVIVHGEDISKYIGEKTTINLKDLYKM